MDEYIERETAIAWFMPYAHAGESIDADVVISDIKGMKAADVAPAVHGRWLDSKHKIFSNTYDYVCSNCGCDYALAKYNYCPNCGAKMDEKDGE